MNKNEYLNYVPFDMDFTLFQWFILKMVTMGPADPS